jgi:hypothetical protein
MRAPSTTTTLSIGVESTSTKRLRPFGIYIISPSIGANSPPHVSGSDQ